MIATLVTIFGGTSKPELGKASLSVGFNALENLITFEAIVPNEGQITIGYGASNMYLADDFCVWY